DQPSQHEVIYTASREYFAAGPTQPREIVERYFRDGAEAIQALKRRRVDLLDRVIPWDLDELQDAPDVVVQRYAMPLIHCLVPNPRKPLTSQGTFRRALVYGIHRQAILDRLLRGAPTRGCQVISGPLSAGMSPEDPLDYAYDHGIEPRSYQPHLAVALKELAFTYVADAMKKQGVEMEEMPQLVLAYPPHEIAEVACEAIEKQLELVDIPITLRELPPGMPSQVPDGVDLLYAELAIWEPVVDARWLLDENGLAGGASPYMSQALRRLDQATDWEGVRSLLKRIHWRAHREVSVVPLYQLTDYFAYHRSLMGVGDEPVSLYQNIEAWQPSSQYVPEEK
ncbi:MAG: ABC transporter substrate-binding protein, partial [Planctomycetota bacterium]